MKTSPATNDYIKDSQRIKELLSYNVLNTPPEKEFDTLTTLASRICRTPIALISLINEEKQWIKSRIGIEEDEFPVEDTICQYTIIQEELFEIENAKNNELVKNNPYIATKEGVRFYAGLPLKSSKGHNIGTVCVVDFEPKKLSTDQVDSLKLIAQQVMHLMEVRKKNSVLEAELLNGLRSKLNQKQAEYDLFYKTVSKTNILIELDIEGNILNVNENAEEITGFKENEFKGQHYSKFFTQSFENEDETVNIDFDLRNDKSNSSRIKTLNKKGKDVWLQVSFNPAKDINGEVSHTIIVAQDITSEVLNQQRLKESKSLAEQLNDQKDQFIANMSHEIRTPINAVLGFTDLLLQIEDEGEKIRHLSSIKDAGDKLLYVVNDILDLSKIEAGFFQIDNRPFSLEQEVLRNVFSMFNLKARDKNLKFEYILNENVPSLIVGDKNRLSQILINLIGNALKFTDEGFVRLSVECMSLNSNEPSSNGVLQFKVSDSGIGIVAEKLDTIFNRFSQENENTSTDYGGTGLGLNISKLLVEKLGGTIQVASEKHTGSEFTFTLPYTIPTTLEIKKLDVKLDFNKGTYNAKVLCCEDNYLNQRLIESIFATTNYDIDIAHDGIEALEYLKEKEYDLILMDVHMPNKNGYETTQEIRENLRIDIPIIGLSAYRMDSAKTKCLKAGMNDYLSKPFSKKEILEKLNYWLLNVEECYDSFDNEFDLSKITEISLSRLDELSGEKKETKIKLMNLFIEESEKNKSELRKIIVSKNRDKLSGLLHQLKSSFGLVGADTFIIEKFEEHIDNNDKTDFKSLEKCLLKQLKIIVLKLRYELTLLEP